ncbi:sigma-54-dependent Fis family transcriptional regulator [Lujinxingia sediminis]|uniref:Sigma-54-dependent Fis family transcriptional regulator n=1 Tax=Lujinxingia sediminis TaxID=2480984 RepID=A0ABY0CTK5_9DELT|nr:sigma-54 dependent transcriptional regulator [Lujinxingia sediminis]RVU44933.1 sigma-54-dependent Fis family transcriptional regulator [Lujinxingia sediminis]
MSDPATDSPARADLPILVVDDERSMREFLTVMLKKEGHTVEVAACGEDATARIDAGERFKLVMTDLKMPGIGGLDVLRAIKAAQPSCQVIVMTAYATAETALSAIKLGAYDYITKPFKIAEARVAVDRALEKFALVSENLYLRDALDHRQGLGQLIGTSRAMQRVFQMIRRVAPTRTTILIHGESGTGKELVARAIHDLSANAEGPFLPINCGAIPENLIESELFGHKKGAFTGAHADKEGLFVAACQGTVFLDEVGELPPSVQVKLLRVLQERKVRPVGDAAEREVTCRIVAATNRDLRQEVQEGRFREDLYYRLSVIPVEMPPLRERGGDVQLLLEHFLHRYAEEIGNPIEGIDARALAILTAYAYPGNVRELQNIVERAVTLETGALITPESLPYHLQEESFSRVARQIDVPEEGVDMEKLVEELERNLIARALERAGGVKTEAARLLNISFRALRYRLDKYGLNDD